MRADRSVLSASGQFASVTCVSPDSALTHSPGATGHVVQDWTVLTLPPGAPQTTGEQTEEPQAPVVSAWNTTPSWGAEEEVVTLENANLVL